MYLLKKKTYKIISMLLVLCMLVGMVNAYPLIAEAETKLSDLFTAETSDYASIVEGSYGMTDNDKGGVDVAYTDVANGNVALHNITTKSSYNVVDNVVHLEVTDIKGKTDHEDEYSFMVFMGKDSGTAWINSLIYADKCIAMAFDQDGRYKIWNTNAANGINPVVPHDSVFAYGKLEESLTSKGDSLTLDISTEDGFYCVKANGEEIRFADTNVPINEVLGAVKFSFHVWAPLNPNTFVQEYLDANGSTLGNHFNSTYAPYGVSYTISDFSIVDLASTLGKGFVDDYNNYITYEIENKMSTIPLTFEAEVYVPEDTDGANYLGVLTGSIALNGATGFDIQAISDGTLQVGIRQGYSKTFTTTLYGAKIPRGVWTHVAIVLDPVQAEDGQYYAYAYINGVQKAKVGFGYSPKLNADKTAWIAGTPVDPTTLIPRDTIILGANNIAADPNPAEGETVANSSMHNEYFRSCFLGRMKSVSFWQKAKTGEEVLWDYTNGTNLLEDGLWGHYILEEGKSTFEDQSTNDNDAVARHSWMKVEELEGLGIKMPVKGEDYEYSMIVVGDTQIINQTENKSIAENYEDSTMTKLYKWIAENKDALNIQFVLGVGDITDENEDVAWKNTDYSYTKYMLNQDIRFASVLGDHDRSVGYNTMTYLQDEKYQANIVENYWKDVKGVDDRMDDTCQTLVIDGIKYLVISLGCGPSDDVLKWAGEMCDKYSDYNVIIHTHQYLQHDGTTLDPINDAKSSIASVSGTGDHSIYEDRNDGEDIWTEVVEKHSNVTLVFSGHIWTKEGIAYSKQTREDGSVVTQMAVNAQDIDNVSTRGLTDISQGLPTGMVSILYFDGEGKIVSQRTYSTIQGKYYYDGNQFDDLGNDVIQPKREIEIAEDSLLLIPGETETLTTILDAGLSDTDIIWSSGDTNVATVDSSTGLITAVATGRTTITATIGDYEATCDVWVCNKTDVNYWESAHVLPISNDAMHNVQECVTGYKVDYQIGAADWHRMNYTKNLYISSTAGTRIEIDNIETETENYSIGVWFGSNNTGWNTVDGYMLLCKNDGKFVIVESKATTGVSGSGVLAQGDIGVQSDALSINIQYDSDGKTLIVKVNGVSCSFVPTKTIAKFAVGAMGDFSINSETSILSYTSLNLTSSPLQYHITYLGWSGNIDSVIENKDYTMVYDYCKTKNVAPEKGGYIFAGWYSDSAGTKKVAADVTKTESGKSYYAKFVPKNVLSVKAQLRLTGNTGKGDLRLVTTIDESYKDYQAVGFVVTNAQGVSKSYESTTAYTSVFAGGMQYNATDFNAVSKMFVTKKLEGVNVVNNPEREMILQAYWVTHDGVTVYGTARRVTIQQGLDAINNSTSIVNE